MFSERLNGKWHVRRLYSVSSWVCFNYPCCDLPTLATFFPLSLPVSTYLLIHSFHPMVFPLCLFSLVFILRCDHLNVFAAQRILPQLSHWTAPDLTAVFNFFSTSNVSSTLGRSAADLTFSYFFSISNVSLPVHIQFLRYNHYLHPYSIDISLCLFNLIIEKLLCFIFQILVLIRFSFFFPLW